MIDPFLCTRIRSHAFYLSSLASHRHTGLGSPREEAAVGGCLDAIGDWARGHHSLGVGRCSDFKV